MSDIHFQPAPIKNKRELYGVEIMRARSLKSSPTRCNRSLWLGGMLLAVWMRPWCPLSFFRNTTDTVFVRVNRVPYIRLSPLSHGAGLLTHSSPRSWVTTNLLQRSHNYTAHSAPLVIRKRWRLCFCFAGIGSFQSVDQFTHYRWFNNGSVCVRFYPFPPTPLGLSRTSLMCFF